MAKVILFLTVLSVTGIFVYYKSYTPRKMQTGTRVVVNTQVTSDSEQGQSIPQALPIRQTEKRRYENKQYGFSFEYRPDFEIDENSLYDKELLNISVAQTISPAKRGSYVTVKVLDFSELDKAVQHTVSVNGLDKSQLERSEGTHRTYNTVKLVYGETRPYGEIYVSYEGKVILISGSQFAAEDVLASLTFTR
jgi:hypothetical protein